MFSTLWARARLHYIFLLKFLAATAKASQNMDDWEPPTTFAKTSSNASSGQGSSFRASVRPWMDLFGRKAALFSLFGAPGAGHEKRSTGSRSIFPSTSPLW